MKIVFVLIFCLFNACEKSSSGGHDGLSAGVNSVQIQHGGLTRGFIVHLPDTLEMAMPVVFAFHGGQGSNGIYAAPLGGLINQRKWIGVYPQGVGGFWNSDIGTSTANDTGFVRAIVGWLRDRVSIDEQRLYALGFSNGAILCHKIARESDLFAAIAPVNGSWLAGQTMGGGAPAVSVLQVTSLNDEIVPYYGGAPQGLNLQSVSAMMDGYAIHNGCGTAKDTLEMETDLSVFTYPGCNTKELKIHRLNQTTHFLDGATWDQVYAVIFDFLDGKSK